LSVVPVWETDPTVTTHLEPAQDAMSESRRHNFTPLTLAVVKTVCMPVLGQDRRMPVLGPGQDLHAWSYMSARFRCCTQRLSPPAIPFDGLLKKWNRQNML